jgi:p-cumate 2,3-dioxygenase beta subunit
MTPAAPVAVHATDDRLLRAVESFLYAEADLLDDWKLDEWFSLFTDPCRYLVPPTDHPDGDPARHLFLIQDDRFLLGQRVKSLLSKSAHAEWPHSRTRRLVTNVRVREHDDHIISVRSNFAVWRFRNGKSDCYVGRYDHQLEAGGSAGFRIQERKATLDLDALRPQGKVSIIL